VLLRNGSPETTCAAGEPGAPRGGAGTSNGPDRGRPRHFRLRCGGTRDKLRCPKLNANTASPDKHMACNMHTGDDIGFARGLAARPYQ